MVPCVFLRPCGQTPQTRPPRPWPRTTGQALTPGKGPGRGPRLQQPPFPRRVGAGGDSRLGLRRGRLTEPSKGSSAPTGRWGDVLPPSSHNLPSGVPAAGAVLRPCWRHHAGSPGPRAPAEGVLSTLQEERQGLGSAVSCEPCDPGQCGARVGAQQTHTGSGRGRGVSLCVCLATVPSGRAALCWWPHTAVAPGPGSERPVRGSGSLPVCVSRVVLEPRRGRSLTRCLGLLLCPPAGASRVARKPGRTRYFSSMKPARQLLILWKMHLLQDFF